MWQSVQIELAAHFVLLPQSVIKAYSDFCILPSLGREGWG